LVKDEDIGLDVIAGLDRLPFVHFGTLNDVIKYLSDSSMKVSLVNLIKKHR